MKRIPLMARMWTARIGSFLIYLIAAWGWGWWLYGNLNQWVALAVHLSLCLLMVWLLMKVQAPMFKRIILGWIGEQPPHLRYLLYLRFELDQLPTANEERD